MPASLTSHSTRSDSSSLAVGQVPGCSDDMCNLNCAGMPAGSADTAAAAGRAFGFAPMVGGGLALALSTILWSGGGAPGWWGRGTVIPRNPLATPT